jgi:hypothetical protein
MEVSDIFFNLACNLLYFLSKVLDPAHRRVFQNDPVKF